MAVALTVLVVDDQPGVRTLLRVLLEEVQCKVVEAATATEGVEQANEWQPDVIVLDWELPDMEGVDALPALRRAVPHTRIVMFSSHTTRQDAERALAAGADDYFEKPNINGLIAYVTGRHPDVIDLRRRGTSPSSGAGSRVQGE
jgi:CheY-like chemotaxis protein